MISEDGKEKELLIIGVTLVLIGAAGTLGVMAAGMMMKPALDSVPDEVDGLYTQAGQLSGTLTAMLEDGAGLLETIAANLRNPQLDQRYSFDALAGELEDYAYSIRGSEEEAQRLVEGMDTSRDLVISRLNAGRLVINVFVVWAGLLHLVILVIGVGFLWIRKRMLWDLSQSDTDATDLPL